MRYEYSGITETYRYEIVAKIIEYDEEKDYIKLEVAPNTEEYIEHKLWYSNDMIAWSEE